MYSFPTQKSKVLLQAWFLSRNANYNRRMKRNLMILWFMQSAKSTDRYTWKWAWSCSRFTLNAWPELRFAAVQSSMMRHSPTARGQMIFANRHSQKDLQADVTSVWCGVMGWKTGPDATQVMGNVKLPSAAINNTMGHWSWSLNTHSYSVLSGANPIILGVTECQTCR